MPTLRHLLDEHQLLLTEGAVIERLRRNMVVQLDLNVAHATLASTRKGRLLLSRIYCEYLDIGREFALPMLVLAPTWRASKERAELSGLSLDLNKAAVDALVQFRDRYGRYAKMVGVGGLMGPKADAYRPATALPADAAYDYHLPQAQALAFAGVDFIMVATLPAVSEAIGIARAIAEQGIQYVLSFVVRPNGTILDGTLLAAAIRKVNASVRPWPLGYMVNCVHPETFRLAVADLMKLPELRPHMLGLQANASRRSPKALDHLAELDAGDPAEFGEQMASLQRDLGLRVLGGCCGTDARHIRAIAAAVTKSQP